MAIIPFLEGIFRQSVVNLFRLTDGSWSRSFSAHTVDSCLVHNSSLETLFVERAFIFVLTVALVFFVILPVWRLQDFRVVAGYLILHVAHG